jgi:hypothetical protein
VGRGFTKKKPRTLEKKEKKNRRNLSKFCFLKFYFDKN